MILQRKTQQLLSIYGATLKLPAGFVQVFFNVDKDDTSLHSWLSAP